MVCKLLVARIPTYIALVEFLFTCSNVNKQHLCYNKIQTQDLVYVLDSLEFLKIYLTLHFQILITSLKVTC